MTKSLKYQFNLLSEVTGIAKSRKEAEEKKQDNYLYLDYYSLYGGYNLVLVSVKTGGHHSFAGFSSCGSRVSSSVMEGKIKSFIDGFKYKN